MRALSNVIKKLPREDVGRELRRGPRGRAHRLREVGYGTDLRGVAELTTRW